MKSNIFLYCLIFFLLINVKTYNIFGQYKTFIHPDTYYAIFDLKGFENGEMMYFRITAKFEKDEIFYRFVDNLDDIETILESNFMDFEKLESYFDKSASNNNKDDDDNEFEFDDDDDDDDGNEDVKYIKDYFEKNDDDDDDDEENEIKIRYYKLEKQEGNYLILLFLVEGKIEIENTEKDEGKASQTTTIVIALVVVVIIIVLLLIYFLKYKRPKCCQKNQQADNNNIPEIPNNNENNQNNYQNNYQNNQNNPTIYQQNQYYNPNSQNRRFMQNDSNMHNNGNNNYMKPNNFNEVNEYNNDMNQIPASN